MSPDDASKPAVVLGAGVAGLTCAYKLKRAGHPVVLLEASSRPGGLINSVRQGPYLLEIGPNTVPDRHGTLQGLIDELGLRDEVIGPNLRAKRRYIVRQGAMVALPSSPLEFARSPFLSPQAKLRLLAEPLVSKLDEPDVDESLAHFVRRRFGQEVVDYALNPFIAGTFGGKPEHLSLEHTFGRLAELEHEAGSIMLGGLARLARAKRAKPPESGAAPGTGQLVNFRRGEQTLTDALARALGDSLRLGASAQTLARQPDGSWRVGWRDDQGQTHTQAASAVVLATPAWAIPSLQATDDGHPIDLSPLGQIPYSPISVCAMAYKLNDLGRPLDAFGVLIPEVEGMKTLGAIFASTIFEGRAPQDEGVMIVFIGGARSPELATLPEAERLALAQADMDQLIGLRGQPLMVKHHTWTRGIPQCEVGYGRILAKIDALERHHEGLLLTGNYLRGISVSDAAHHANQTHARVLELARRRAARQAIEASLARRAARRGALSR